ncbi:MAG: DUF551 domain-containing protein [Bacillota bacterium]
MTTTEQALKKAREALKRLIEEPKNTMSDGKAIREMLRQAKIAESALAALSSAEAHPATDERAAFEAWATKEGTYDLRPAKWKVLSVQGQMYDGHVRPYLQDRTVHTYQGFVAGLTYARQAQDVAVRNAALEEAATHFVHSFSPDDRLDPAYIAQCLQSMKSTATERSEEVTPAQAQQNEKAASDARWVSVNDRLPPFGENHRVLIYTEGYDFNGEQFFDVQADSLNEESFEYPEDMPEVCRYASHWMWLPLPTSTPYTPAEKRVAELEAARLAYASEFPPNADGEPDVDNIHANIRKLKMQAQQSDLPPQGNWEWLIGRTFSIGEVVDICDESATVRRGDDEFRILVCELMYAHFQAERNKTSGEKGEQA